SAWRANSGTSYRAVGFSQSVTLGELGEAFENPEQVMQVELFDYFTHEDYRVAGEPLFHGALLHTYRRGRWSRRSNPGAEPKTMKVTEDLPLNEQLVLQRITVEPLEEEVLFSIHPSFQHVRNPELLYSEES